MARELTPEQQDLVRLVRGAVGATDDVFARIWEQVAAILGGLDDRPLTVADRRAIMRDVDVVLDQMIGLTQGRTMDSPLFQSIVRSTDRAAEAPYRRATATLKDAVEKKAPGFWEKRIVTKARVTSTDPLLQTMAVLDGPMVEKQRMLRAGKLDPQRRWVPKERHNTDTGYRLSDRIWKGGQDVRASIDERIREGVRRGQSPLTIADDLEQYLNPDFASVVYGEDGSIVRRNETTAAGGKGNTYARRLARTEVSRIHGAATLESAKVVPGIAGIKWLLSNRHFKADECNQRAEDDSDNLGKGVYKLENVPLFPSHTQCLCTLAHAHEDSDEFIDKLIAKYSGQIRRPRDYPDIVEHLSDPEVIKDRRNEQVDIDTRLREARHLTPKQAEAEVSTLRTQGGVIVGSIPKAPTDLWEAGSGDEVTIRASRRRHYRREHPETKTMEDKIIETVRDPERAFTYPVDPTVVNLTSTLDDEHDLFVSVQLAYEDERFAVVRSARRQSKAETERWQRMGRQVWGKESRSGESPSSP